jgi:hypothetical protein
MLAVDTPIEIYFNTPMDEATLTADTVTIVGSSSGNHAGAFTCQADQMALFVDPDTDFLYDELVTVTVTTAVTDDDGDPLASDYTFSFRTRPESVSSQSVAGQTITTDVTWTAAGGPYYVLGNIIVDSTGSLTIEAGTVVKFDTGKYLQADGVLDTEGTADNRVVFISYRDDQYGGDTNGDGPSSGARGDWKYVNLQNSSITFDHSIVRYAGVSDGFGLYASSASTPVIRDNVVEYCGCPSSFHGGIRVQQDSNPTIEDNIVRGGSGHLYAVGIRVENDSDAMIRGNTIIGHSYGLSVASTNVEVESNAITNATYAVHTNGGIVRGNDIRNSSYAVNQGRRSDSVIEANTFTAIANHVIRVHGTLESDFVWEDVQSMGWAYLVIEPVVVPANRALTIPAGTVVKFQPDTYLQADGILDAQGTPDNGVVFTSYRDDQYGGDTNGDGPSSGARGDWHYIDLQNNSITFDHSVVRYAGRGGTSGLLISNASTPMVRDNVLEHCGIQNGDRRHGGIRVRQGANPLIENNMIRGGTGNKRDEGIRVNGDSQATIRGNTVIGHYWGTFSEATGVIVDENIISGATYAVYTNGGEVRNNDIRNSSYALYQGLKADAIIENNSFTQITYPVIAVSGTTESDFAWDDVQRVGWPYLVTGDATVSAGTTLTIDPGMVVKFHPVDNGPTNLTAEWTRYKHDLIVAGTMDLAGAPGQEVVFTSFRDDAYGGDSNGDGAGSVPAAGNWGAIKYTNPNNVLHDAIIRYGGLGWVRKHYGGGLSYHDKQMVWAAGSVPGTLEIRDCVVEHAWGHGVYGEPGTSPWIHHNVVAHAGKQGIQLGGTATVEQNEIYGNAGYGVLLQGGALNNNRIFGNTGGGAVANGVTESLSVRNNLIYSNGGAANSVGVLVDDAARVELVNNTIYQTAGDTLRIDSRST